MKKHNAMAMLVAALTTLVTANTYASTLTRAQTAEGRFSVTESTDVTLTVAGIDGTIDPNASSGTSVGSFSVETENSATVAARFAEQPNSDGYGVARTAQGDEIRINFQYTNGRWKDDANGGRAVVADTTKLYGNVTLADSLNHAAGGEYTYMVEGGYWQD